MMHLFHTVGILWSFKKKLCYTIFCKLWCANIFGWTLLHCGRLCYIVLILQWLDIKKNKISKKNSVSCCFFGTRGNN